MIRVPTLEIAILQVAWGFGDRAFTAKEIFDALPDKPSGCLIGRQTWRGQYRFGKRWTYTTVKTVLDRLVAAGMMVTLGKMSKKGSQPPWLYGVVITKDEYVGMVMHRLEECGLVDRPEVIHTMG